MQATRAAGRQIWDHCERVTGPPAEVVNTSRAVRVFGFHGSVRSEISMSRAGNAAQSGQRVERHLSEWHGPLRRLGLDRAEVRRLRGHTHELLMHVDCPTPQKVEPSSSRPNTSPCRRPDPITRSTTPRSAGR